MREGSSTNLCYCDILNTSMFCEEMRLLGEQENRQRCDLTIACEEM